MRDFISTIDVVKIRSKIGMGEELTQKILENKELPTLLENVEGHSTRVFAGLVSTRDLLARSIGATADELVERVGDAYDSPLPLETVEEAPFLENHIESPDVSQVIPIPEFHGGKRYLTASIVIAKSPVTGRRNASIHRMMYLGEDRFAIRPVPQRDLHNFYTSAFDKGADHLDIAIVLGVHPAFELGAATSYPDLDELEFASRLMGGAKQYVLNGFGIPADAEIVMLGRMMRELVDEGPFVDLTGTSDHVRKQPLVVITDIYYRNNPIFRTILPGRKEHKMLMGIPQEPRMMKMIRNTLPTVRNVVMTEGGGSWLHAVVQIKKRTHGDGKNAILAALAAHPSLKRVVVVDEDIDPTDPVDVEWAIATRFQPDRDMVIIPGAKGSSLDPSAGEMSTTAKWGLDCTKPLGVEGFDRVI